MWEVEIIHDMDDIILTDGEDEIVVRAEVDRFDPGSPDLGPIYSNNPVGVVDYGEQGEPASVEYTLYQGWEIFDGELTDGADDEIEGYLINLLD